MRFRRPTEPNAAVARLRRLPARSAIILDAFRRCRPERDTVSLDVINHIEIAVTDAERSRRFYEAALSPLGLALVISTTGAVNGGARYGFGRDGYPSFWIHGEPGINRPVHIAFTGADRAAVNAFYKAALASVGTDNGGPGIRERYHPSYFAAYVLDPDGNNIEAVCQSS